MADVDQGAVSVAVATDSTRGTQTDSVTLSPLYDQLGEAGKKALKNPARYSKLAKLGDLVGEIDRLDGEYSKAIRVPGQGASDEEWRKYREALGVPQSPEGYRLTRPNLPQGMPYSEDLERWFRTQLHKANVPDSVAQAMFNDWNRMQVERWTANVAAVKRNYEKGMADLKQTWGDKYDEEMAMNAKAYQAYLSPTLLQKIKARGLDNDPEFIMMWNKIGHSISEDQMVVSREGSGDMAGKAPRESFKPTRNGFVLRFPQMEKGYANAPGLRFPVRNE